MRPTTLPRPVPVPELHAFGEPDNGIVGESPAIWQLREQLAFAAQTRDHVFIDGESGAGKELAAQAVHKLSPRANGALVSRSAPTIPPSLVALELFGNPEGHPHLAMPARPGLLGAAGGGTLFLDHIGDSPLDLPAQLLRVLDHGEYQAVGEATVRRVDVRVVAAANQFGRILDPKFLARFRCHVRVPPLRERREDIPLLIRHWLLQHAQRYPELRQRFLRKRPDGRLQPKVSAELVDHLVRHPLPLNTRDIHRILLTASGSSPGDELRMPTADAPG